MSSLIQGSLFAGPELKTALRECVLDILKFQQPTAGELIELIEDKIGPEARWSIREVLQNLSNDHSLTSSRREYLHSMIEDGSLRKALRGEDAPDRETISSIDLLLAQGQRYRKSKEFQEMIEFIGLFRDYAPYNNMLVKVQNPSCGFYATAKDWRGRFKRQLKEDARPMLILAPMTPVMLVYDLDQTEGDELPEELTKFAHFTGDWDPRYLSRLVENIEQYLIQVQFKELSSTLAGFATARRGNRDWKRRIVIHDALDGPSRFGVLCHEAAHILLGHLGSDHDYWWPARTELSHSAVEIEAESVAWIVSSRLGLEGASAAYVSGYSKEGNLPVGVSVDMIAKTAGLIERMARGKVTAPKPRKPKKHKIRE